MASQRVVVVGSSFAGYTAAMKLRNELSDAHKVVVLDARDVFAFIPSLIWLRFGLRKAADITFQLAPAFERKGIRFANEADAAASTASSSAGHM